MRKDDSLCSPSQFMGFLQHLRVRTLPRVQWMAHECDWPHFAGAIWRTALMPLKGKSWGIRANGKRTRRGRGSCDAERIRKRAVPRHL